MKQILLATPDKGMLALLVDFLVEQGFIVSAVFSIQQAKTLLVSHQFEVIIVDLDFQSGLLDWNLKPYGNNLIVLTPIGEAKGKFETEHVLEKPVKLDVLKKKINQIVKGR